MRTATPAPVSRWRNPRAVVAHVVLALWVPGCAVACWWQVTVAETGNPLGWVYSVMWPCFAVFGTVLWWNIVHDDPDTVGARGVRRLRGVAEETAAARQAAVDAALARAEEEDAELAAYNAYLAELGRRGGATKRWRQR